MKNRLLFFMTLFWTVWSFGQTFTSGGIKYNVSSTSPATVEVAKNGPSFANPFTGSIANIPSTVTNNSVVYAVTRIGNEAFFSCNALTTVTIPNSVTSIGNSAFALTSLLSVTIPNSVISIGNLAFYYCLSIDSVTIPNSVISIGYSAFNQCQGLNSVTISNSVSQIGDLAFSNCLNLNSVTVNWTTPLSNIGAYTFSGTPSNKRLHVPIGSQAAYATAAVWSNFNINPVATHLNFDGGDDSVILPASVNNAISQGSEITIEYWFKGTNLQSAVCLQDGNNFIIAGFGGNNPQFIVSTDGGTNGVLNGTESVIEDNTWHHIACVWKKNVMFATYLDGVLQNSRVAANVNLPDLSGVFGTLGSMLGVEFMTGNLDDVRIWNVARTAAQIAAARNCELQGNESGLVAYYKFNQGLNAADNTAITTLTNATATANNGTLVNFAKTGTTSNFLAGSPVTTGSTIPTAPSASAQSFCGTTTANSLVPAISTTIKWYASATALVTTDNLTSGTYYVVAVNANGCESDRTAVSVLVAENPNPQDTQFFCNSATVNDLEPAPSTTITWFTDQAATTPLAPNSALANNTTYYVQAVANGCPPSTPIASTVAITSATAPTNIGGEVTVDANKNLNVIYTGADCPSLNGLYVVNGTLNGKNVYRQLDGMRTIGYDNINNKWKLYYGNDILISLTASNNSTANYPPASGWILEECVGTLTTATAFTYNQIICENSDATHLMPPPSATIKWFESATGTNNLAPNDLVVNASVYYVAGVNANGCESPRTAVSVSFLPKPAAPILVGTPTANSGIAVSVTGGCSNFNGDYYLGITDSNGKNVYENETNNTRIYYDNVNQKWVLGTYVSDGVYDADFINVTTSSNAFPPTTGWTVADSFISPCAGSILSIGYTQIEQNYCQIATAANIAGTDPSLKIYNSTGQIALTTPLTTGMYAVATVGANGCESDVTLIQINIETAAPAPTAVDQNFCTSGTVADLVTTSGTNIKWYTATTGGTALATTTPLTSTNYFATQTTGTCESASRTIVSVTVNSIPLAPTANTQIFEKYTTTSNLVASGTNLKWYNVEVNGTALANSAPIYTGTYFVSQTINGCESASRTAVTIIVDTATWDGSAWVNNIVPNTLIGAVFIGNYAQAINLVAKGVEVIGTSIVSIPTGFDFTVDNYIEVASTASFVFENNANLLQYAAAATTTGNVIFKRNTTMQRLAYTNWSSPVANQNALAFSPLTTPTRFYTYNEGTNGFTALANPSTSTLVPAVGYIVRAPNTFADAPGPATSFVGTFTGTPNNGNYSYVATNSGVNKGYNLIGNPYPSTMLASEFFAANSSVQALYFWDNANLGYIGNRYSTRNLASSLASAVSPTKLPTDFIAVGQGFYVLVNANATLNFTNIMRSTENLSATFFRNAATDKSFFKLNLLGATNTFNQIAIGYMNGATSGIDNQIDAVPFAPSNTMVSSLINNVDYVIQGRSLPFANTDIVPLGFKTDVAGNYSFTSEAFEGVFANNQNIFLKDNLMGTTHNIKQSPYQFTSNVGTFNSRFEIVYQSTLSIENPNFNDNNVFVFVKNDNININSGKVNMKNVQVFDIRGRLVFDKKEVNATQFEIENLKVEQAVLIVKITSEDGSIVSKKIIY